MVKYTIKKLTGLIITLLLISAATFIAFTVIPGNAALSKLGMDAEPEAVEALKESLGMNEAPVVRYLKWLVAALSFDFGTSIQYGLSVNSLISARLPIAVTLILYSFVIVTVLSLLFGITSALKPGKSLDGMITTVSQLGMAIPQFFLGMLLTYIFGIVLKIFEVGGYVSVKEDPEAFFSFLIMPAFAIAIPKAAMMTRYIRDAVVEEKHREFVRTARSIGMSEQNIMLNRVLRSAITPTITMLAMTLAEITAGSIVVEQVFNIPGIGRLLIASISNRDYPVVEAIVVLIAFVVVTFNTIADLLYKIIDPRLRSESEVYDEK